MNICFDFQQLYPYLTLMKMRLVSNYSRCINSRFDFRRSLVPGLRLGEERPLLSRTAAGNLA